MSIFSFVAYDIVVAVFGGFNLKGEYNVGICSRVRQ